jgi:hypothetical protein
MTRPSDEEILGALLSGLSDGRTISAPDRREEFIAKIKAERLRQLSLPNSEYDARNTPNDWLAIASSYCLGAVTRKHSKPNAEEFEDELIKAAAVILAALENLDAMVQSGTMLR